MERRGHFALWVLCSVVLFSLAALFSRATGPAFPPFERPVMEVFSTQDMGMVLNGARRLGADLAFIQLMQYYGTPENADPNHPRGRKRKVVDERHEDEHEGHVHLHLGTEGYADSTTRPSGAFPQLMEYALRAASLDHRFHFLFLFSSGALAFNLNRGEEAMTVLERGIRADPAFWRYRLYQGAIAYRKNQEIEKAISNLEEAIRYPDCPSMIKNILANIYVKKGNYARAREIYLDLLNSRDGSYRVFAETRLRSLPAASAR